MPNFDRTGPQGKGPMGRRLGGCQLSEEMISGGDNPAWSEGSRSIGGRSGTGRRCRGMGGGRSRQRGQISQR